jgi:hypothetical protein
MITFYKLPLSSLRAATRYARKGGNDPSPPPPPPEVPPPPPPPDYAAQKEALWATNQQAAAHIVNMGDLASKGENGAAAWGQANVIPYQITKIDEQLAILAAAPSDAVNFPQDGDRVRATTELIKTRDILQNLQRIEFKAIPPAPPPPIYNQPPPPFTAPPALPSTQDLLIDEVRRQTAILSTFNRVFSRPIEPAQPEFIWPLGSWQYNLWSKGYTMREISATEEKIAITGLLNTNVSDNYTFQLKTEDIAGEFAIEFSNNGVNTKSEVMPVCGLPLAPVRESDDGRGTISILPIFEDNPVVSDCQVNDWCNVVSDNTKYKTPDLAVDLNDPRRRARLRRLARTDIRIPFKGSNTVDVVQIRKSILVQAQDSRPKIKTTPSRQFCATGYTGTQWEGDVMGRGATVAEMDTVRRMMASSFPAPGSNLAVVALEFLATIRSRTGEGTRTSGQVQSLQNEITQINGVVRSSLSPTAMDRATLIARRATQRQKRSLIR